MAKEVRLPQLGQTMEEGTVVSTLVKQGDHVKKGDVIFEIETDKATLDMESPVEGYIKILLVQQDQTLAVGAPMLVIGAKDELIPQNMLDSLLKEGISVDTGTSQDNPDIEQNGQVIPEQQIDAEVLAESASAVTEFRLGQSVPLTSLQRITAQKMLKSKREIPCFYLTAKADVTAMVQKINELAEQKGLKVSCNDFIIKALGCALVKYPVMTGQLNGEIIDLAESIHIGLSVSSPAGLIVPVVKDADKNSLSQIAQQTALLTEKANNRKLLPYDIEGACCTVSNLGAFSIENFIPIPIPGQCFIIGIGQITDVTVSGNGGMVMRKSMSMTISVDHKVVNGAYAAQFLDYFRKLLEDTSTLVPQEE